MFTEPDPGTQTPSKESKQESKPESLHASTKASTLAVSPTDLVEAIRKSVKRIGKDVIYVRLTQEEKEQLADIVYTHKRQGTKTSENEIARIGLNYLVEDYKINGKESVLARVIAALNA